MTHTSTFYIVSGKIVYTLDTGDEEAIDHYQLWDFVVDKLFHFVEAATRKTLKTDAVYGTDRGRVVFRGEKKHGGKYTLNENGRKEYQKG